MQEVNDLLGQCPFAVVPIAVQPQKARETHGKRRKADRTNQGNEIVEDGNGFSEDERYSAKHDRAAHPSSPVNDCVGLKMAGFAQNPNENVFGRNLSVTTS